MTLTRPQLLELFAGKGHDGITIEGDSAVFGTILSLSDEPDATFNIVTP